MEKNELLVTITTVSLNSEKTIARAIESVLKQTYPHIEYIIKDGGSTDQTLAIARSYNSKFKEKGYSFKIISQEDSGMYDALNQANELANGIIVGNVNTDDYFEPDAVAAMVEEYQRSHFDMAYADLRIISGKRIKIKRAKLKSFMSTRYWNHPTTFIKKSVLMEEKYATKTIYDDFDLVLRIRKKYKVVVINKVLSNFTFGGMSNKRSLREAIKRTKIKMKIYRRNGYHNPLYLFDTLMIEFAKLLF